MDLATVRANLATAAATASASLDGFDYVPDVVYPPTVAVGRMRLDYNKSMGGLLEAEFTLHLFASRADTEEGQSVLIPFMGQSGATTIKGAVEADKTLSGACATLRVESADGPGLVDVGGVQFWAASWTVRIWG